jgi:hypothetical protein
MVNLNHHNHQPQQQEHRGLCQNDYHPMPEKHYSHQICISIVLAKKDLICNDHYLAILSNSKRIHQVQSTSLQMYYESNL